MGSGGDADASGGSASNVCKGQCGGIAVNNSHASGTTQVASGGDGGTATGGAGGAGPKGGNGGGGGDATTECKGQCGGTVVNGVARGGAK